MILTMLLHIDEIHISLPFFDLPPFLNRNRARNLKLITSGRLGITTLGFIEIDDVPDGIEILADHRFSERWEG